MGLAERALALLGDEGGLRDLPRLRMHLASVLLEGDEPDAGAALRELDRAQESLAGSQAGAGRAGPDARRGAGAGSATSRPRRPASRSRCSLLGDAPRMETARALVLSGDVAFARDDRRTGRAAYRRAADMLSMMQSNRAAARVWREPGRPARRVRRREGGGRRVRARARRGGPAQQHPARGAAHVVRLRFAFRNRLPAQPGLLQSRSDVPGSSMPL
ncbi:hypothetical protein GCM10025868_15410 [Angustibacter aerolatus]|uniref:Bacterial transcriptional activator domain-containing protein n=1 Tax=Angustibacter aerolatus TaxID=1162965 RepID=A0ABQ6JDM9_9ACTN|nr:hypothetical protein GCM10025868_15410 [Angustibacter aerolatus]